MSASSAGRGACWLFTLLALAALCHCRRPAAQQEEAPAVRGAPPAAARPEPAPVLNAFAEPGEDAPISHIAVDPITRYLVAVSRLGRKIGGTHIPTGLWSWKTRLAQPPALVVVHPMTGEGFLVWQNEGAAGVVAFRPATGETLGALDLGALPGGPLQSAALDQQRNRLYLASAQGILCVDLAGRRVLPALAGSALLPFLQALDLAVDSQRALAVIPHAGGGVTILDLTAWGSYGARLPAAEIQIEAPHDGAPTAVAVDSEQGRAYVLDGREWAEIDLETRQIVRWTAFEPERHFSAGRIAVAGPCRRLYLACADLIEADLDSGQWEPVVAVGDCPAPVVHAPGLGALFTLREGQIYSAFHRCGPGDAE